MKLTLCPPSLLTTFHFGAFIALWIYTQKIKIFLGKKFDHQGLPDELWIDILSRLSCEEVFTLKSVSKYWHSLISHPSFIASFIQHKRRTTPTQTTTNTVTKWFFLLQTQKISSIVKYDRPFKSRFIKQNFTGLKFLPFHNVTIASTFKDLILCYNPHPVNEEREYHICNPLTKQWSSLPPSPLLPFDIDRSWAALICEEPEPYHDNHEQGTNYRFRVVIVHPFPEEDDNLSYDPFGNINLVVFCSEIGQWKQVILVIPTNDFNVYRDDDSVPFTRKVGFDGVVCNRMLYLRHNLMFGTFNPFRVNADSNLTIVADGCLPLPLRRGSLHEHHGHVLFLAFEPFFDFKMMKLKKYGDYWGYNYSRWYIHAANMIKGLKCTRPSYFLLTSGTDKVSLWNMSSVEKWKDPTKDPDLYTFTFEFQPWPTAIPTISYQQPQISKG